MSTELLGATEGADPDLGPYSEAFAKSLAAIPWLLAIDSIYGQLASSFGCRVEGKEKADCWLPYKDRLG